MPTNKLASIITLIALSTAPLGCATTGSRLQKTTEAAANVLMPTSQENELGAQLSTELEKEIKLHPDPEVQKYISDMGAKIVAAARKQGKVPEGIEFTFKVIDDPNTVNAFAMPGGYIYFYTGLLLAADSEAEVIGVMGHEVAHVTERHVAERLITAYGLQAITDMALGKEPGQVAQLAASLAGQGYLLKYGRGQESESDEVGFGFVVDAGYNPAGMAKFFEKLDHGGASPPEFMSSHPNPADRAERIKAMIKERGDVPSEMGEDVHKALMPKFRSATAPATEAEAPATPEAS